MFEVPQDALNHRQNDNTFTTSTTTITNIRRRRKGFETRLDPLAPRYMTQAGMGSRLNASRTLGRKFFLRFNLITTFHGFPFYLTLL
jgi:hypothetical protein